MLYVFTGTDTAKAKARARALAKDFEVIVCGEGGEPFERALGFVGAQGLFAPKAALILDRPSETEEGKVLIEENAEVLHQSDNPVFVIETKLLVKDLKNFPKGIKKESFEREDVGEREAPPSVFAFTDAYLTGNKKKSWILFRQLVASGAAPEEIHGALMWAVRSALLASKTKNAAESGLKPFVYTKSKRAAEKLGAGKVEELSRGLVSVYHRARRGEAPLEDLIEFSILST